MSVIGETFTFDLEGMLMDADKTRVAYQAARPFPHIVIDDFLAPDALDAAIAAFPPPDSSVWLVQNSTVRGHPVSVNKKACNEELQIPVPLRKIGRELNCSLFLRFLSIATGIPFLLPDPIGNALFLIEPGGFLNLHADYSHHLDSGLEHRVNLLLYFNRDWPEAYGGHLEFHRPGDAAPPRGFLPIANRCVIFDSTSESYHGHPRPLTCPPGRTRTPNRHLAT
ncbi:MAG: 2OG-Fe(II) oxygenase [Proteobacteria bacterium]|nr:2OG-Fe(II) oxygenase [Pseudomonadota bacterium]